MLLLGWMDGEPVVSSFRRTELTHHMGSSIGSSAEVRASLQPAGEPRALASLSSPLTRVAVLQYPDATILVLRLGQRSFYRSSSHLHRTYEPAVAYLRARFPSATSGPTSPLLVHTFSNGGCTTLKAVDELLQASATDVEQEREPLVTKGARGGVPARAIVFDSCPGRTSTLRTTLAAFTAPFKTWWTRWPATVLISALYALLKLKERCAELCFCPSTSSQLTSFRLQ